MRGRTARGLGAGVVAGCLCLAGCSLGTTQGQGPIKDFCGQRISSAVRYSGVPWYRDATTRSSRLRLAQYPAAVRAGTWVQVSGDCRTGASVRVSDSTVLEVGDTVRATSGRYLAVRVLGIRVGTATVQISGPVGTTRTVTVQVVPIPRVTAPTVTGSP